MLDSDRVCLDEIDHGLALDNGSQLGISGSRFAILGLAFQRNLDPDNQGQVARLQRDVAP